MKYHKDGVYSGIGDTIAAVILMAIIGFIILAPVIYHTPSGSCL
jgi:hypothetical protein